jgi:hypothetical protein
MHESIPAPQDYSSRSPCATARMPTHNMADRTLHALVRQMLIVSRDPSQRNCISLKKVSSYPLGKLTRAGSARLERVSTEAAGERSRGRNNGNHYVQLHHGWTRHRTNYFTAPLRRVYYSAKSEPFII